MTTFRTWLLESEQETRERLEAAVREYMSTKPPPERCYYVPYSDVNPESPEEMERLVGQGYDRTTKAVRGNHPTAFKCIGVAHDLARFLKDKGFKARVVTGWYGKTGKGYPHEEIRLDSPSAPGGFKYSGRGARQHWWVEAEGFYVDLTSAQFHPLSPQDQRDMVIRSKRGAFEDGEYAPVRRLPLGRRVRLPAGILKMIDKIASLKKFMRGRSGNSWDLQRLEEWIRKNASKYGLDASRLEDLFMSMQGQDFYFADKATMARTFGEVFDDMDDDETPEVTTPFKPPEPKRSRGTVRHAKDSVSLSSTTPDRMEENFDALASLMKKHFPTMVVGEPRKSSYRGRNGEVFEMRARLECSDDSWISMWKWPPEYDKHPKAFFKELKKEGFSEPRH